MENKTHEAYKKEQQLLINNLEKVIKLDKRNSNFTLFSRNNKYIFSRTRVIHVIFRLKVRN